MATRVNYRLEGRIASVDIDDGKVNAMSPDMQTELAGALDRAASDGAVVVLSGRTGVFSAGFDLRILQGGGAGAVDMVKGGFELAARFLAHPTPIIAACTGHAIAMGAFLLLACDYRVGAEGPFKLVANEVQLGLTMPRAAIELLRGRLIPAAFERATLLAEQFAPDAAVVAGFLDRVVPAGEVVATAALVARAASTLDANAHARTKLRSRERALADLRAAIAADDAELRAALVT